MLILTLTARVPQFHPPRCTSDPSGQQVCLPPTTTQFAILIQGLCWMAIGTGGIKPCTILFAIDQFDTTSPEGKKGVSSFFSWYCATQTLFQLTSLTIIVYIQNKNWVLGFGTPGVLMVCAVILFFPGTKVYAYIPPEGTIFSGIAPVFVAACKKHRLQNPSNEENAYYDPLLEDDETVLKMPLTKQLSRSDTRQRNAQGRVTNSWRICSIQQVEEVKCLIKIMPIWASGILCFIPIAQQNIFPVSQATKLNRHLGPHFEIPSASCSVVSLITIGIWLPCYELFVQPALAKITKQKEGLTSLQKIILGNMFSNLAMVTAGLVEGHRRGVAISLGAPMFATWLAPQFILLGFCEVFTIVGHIEFYNSESLERMRSIGSIGHAGYRFLKAKIEAI
ncbi:hypothetical protein JHK87_000396 [Glycine soja]|nr:hypothetical protein JHK87_000396 [Glycine soja]